MNGKGPCPAVIRSPVERPVAPRGPHSRISFPEKNKERRHGIRPAPSLIYCRITHVRNSQIALQQRHMHSKIRDLVVLHMLWKKGQSFLLRQPLGWLWFSITVASPSLRLLCLLSQQLLCSSRRLLFMFTPRRLPGGCCLYLHLQKVQELQYVYWKRTS